MSDNLEPGERDALSELISLTRSNIEIKKADKSNTLVLMEKEDYKEKLVLDGHLRTETYEKSEPESNQKVYKNLVKLCSKHENCLTKAERKLILRKDWSESNFYILPKIHKSKEILEKIQRDSSEYIVMPMPQDLKADR